MGHKNTFQPQNVRLISVEADEREVSALYSEGMRKEGGGGGRQEDGSGAGKDEGRKGARR